MSKAAVFKTYQRALAHWPKDVLRPDVSFQHIFQRRLEKRLGNQEQDLDENKEQRPLNDTTKLIKASEEANALFSLLENRYTKKYPLSQQTLAPKSNPQHYQKLLTELEEAPQRSWLTRKINQWKGFLRFT